MKKARAEAEAKGKREGGRAGHLSPLPGELFFLRLAFES
jgi:hypothetical protein